MASMLKTTPAFVPDYAHMAAIFQDLGGGPTAAALQHKFRAIKHAAKEYNSKMGVGSGNEKATPTKKGILNLQCYEAASI